MSSVQNYASSVSHATSYVSQKVSQQYNGNDLGSSAVGTYTQSVSTVAALSLKSSALCYSAAYNATPGAIEATKNIGDFTYKGVRTVDSALAVMMYTGVSHSAFEILKQRAAASGLDQTKIALKIMRNLKNLQTGVAKIRTGTAYAINTAAYVYNNMDAIIAKGLTNLKKGIVTGCQKIKSGTVYVAKQVKTSAIGAYSFFAQNGAYALDILAARAIKTGVNVGAAAGVLAAKVGWQGMKFTVTKAIPKVGVSLWRGGIGATKLSAGALKTSNDVGLQSLGHAASATAAAAQVAPKVAKTTVKVGFKTAKGVYNGVSIGVRTGVHIAKDVASMGVKLTLGKWCSYAGNKIAEVMLEFIKSILKKFIIPLIIICCVVMVLNMLMIPVIGVASVFGGIFSNEGSEFDINEFLASPSRGIPYYLDEKRNEIWTDMQVQRDYCDILRFKTNEVDGGGSVLDATDIESISRAFPDVNEFQELIQPLMISIIERDYDGDITEEEAAGILQHIINTIVVIDVVHEEELEWCGQDIATGEGEPDEPGDCGGIHARADCPNDSGVYYHEEAVCSCDHTVDYTFTYCEGHNICNGHQVITYTVNSSGMYRLMAEYFEDPIAELEAKEELTSEEQDDLQNLYDSYEMYEQVAAATTIVDYSAAISYEELATVNWVESEDRTGCNGIIEYASQYLGRDGTMFYQEVFGAGHGYEAWCACFVYYQFKHSGYGSSSPILSMDGTSVASCINCAASFDTAHWESPGFTNLVAGDVIYFDYKNEGETHHTGLVIGRDENRVYTIEGNSGRRVRVRSYALDSGCIYGYGLIDY